MIETLQRILHESAALFVQMAPYLLLGFAANALVALFVPERWITKHLGQPGFKGVLWATLIGIPLPLCSCSVLPMALGLRSRGASVGATIAFLIATPQTGVDSILVTGQMIGWPFALFKVAAALVTGLTAGWLAERWLSKKEDANTNAAAAAQAAALDAAAGPETWSLRTRRALAVGFLDFPASLGGALMLGILVGGALTALVPTNYLTSHDTGSKLLAMAAMLTMAVPMYVCSTGSVPIAAAFHHAGVSQGALLVFLMAGPATNIAEISVIRKRMGWKALAVFLGVIIVASMALGLLFEDVVQVKFDGSGAAGAMAGHEHHTMAAGASPLPAVDPLTVLSPLDWLAVAALTLLLAFPFVKKIRAAWNGAQHEDPAMATTDNPKGAQTYEFALTGLNCEHCIRSTRNSLEGLPGLEAITVSLQKAVLKGKDLNIAEVEKRVKNQGFEAHLVAPASGT